jgi:hypothetical protein
MSSSRKLGRPESSGKDSRYVPLFDYDEKRIVAVSMTTLSSDLIRAARLDSSLYAQAKVDTTTIARALSVVALLALAHGVGGAIRATAFERDSPFEGFLIGVYGEVVFWAVAASVVYLVGTSVLGGTATYGQVLRPFSFAGVPGLLILVAALASLLDSGAQIFVFTVLVPWRVAASFVAVRQGLQLDRVKSSVALLAGAVCGLVMVTVGTTLATVLEILG